MDQFVIYNLQYNAFQNDDSINSLHLANEDANAVKEYVITYAKSMKCF